MINRVVLNDDGISVKGCSMIYAPAGRAGEYAALATNPYRGCGHKCAYCYVPNVLRMPRQEFNKGAYPRPNFIAGLKKDALKYKQAGITEQVLLSFTTDPYHPGDNSLTRETLEVLALNGLSFCTLTKGGTRSLRDIDLFRPGKDAFASTLTSLDDSFSLKWEPGAALPDDRLDAIKKFHEAGIFTWVSLEPTIDAETSLKIVEETYRYVNFYKIGKANYIPESRLIDWNDYTNKMINLCQKLGVAHYIKKDLQTYLPAGYQNSMGVTQSF